MQITADMIRSARNRLGESQATFAERFGVSQVTVSRWEAEGAPRGGAAGKAIEIFLNTMDEGRAA